MPTDHVIDPAAIHHAWDRELPPALTIASGDRVAVDVPMAGHGQVPRDGAYADCAFDFDTLYHLAGPIAIEGAEPGHTLQVDMLELIPGDWGWTVIMPELGLLPDRFPEGHLRTFDLTGGAIAVAPGVAVPVAPFFGTLGTAPDRPGPLSPFPPHEGGGNLDNRHLVAGSTLWLPVHVPGALFSVGDPHAAQGDGEVCVSACECPMRATLRFTLLETPISAPSFRTVPAPRPGARRARHDGDRARPDGGRQDRRLGHDRLARRRARPHARGRLRAVLARGRSQDPRDRRRGGLQRGHGDAARRPPIARLKVRPARSDLWPN